MATSFQVVTAKNIFNTHCHASPRTTKSYHPTHQEPILEMLAFIIFHIVVIIISYALARDTQNRRELMDEMRIRPCSCPPSPSPFSVCAAKSPQDPGLASVGSGGQTARAPAGVSRDVGLGFILQEE